MSRKGSYIGGHVIYTSKNLSRGERLTHDERTKIAEETKAAALVATKRNVELGIVSARMRRRMLANDRQVKRTPAAEEERLAHHAQVEEARLAARKEAVRKKKTKRKEILARDNPPSVNGRIVAKRDGIVTEVFFAERKKHPSRK